MPQPPRFAARTRALSDGKLTYGARFFYAFLDDLAMGNGWFRKQQHVLAAMSNASVRSVQEWLVELRQAGYISPTPYEGGAQCYVLSWASHPGVKAITPGCETDYHSGVKPPGRSMPMGIDTEQQVRTNEQRPVAPVEKSYPVLTRCDRHWRYFEGPDTQICESGHTHDPSRCSIIDPIAEAEEWLLYAARASGAVLGHPDREIILRALIASGGPVRLWLECRRLGNERLAAEARSWGWFVSVLTRRVA